MEPIRSEVGRPQVADGDTSAEPADTGAISLDNRTFRALEGTTGDVDRDTVFHYRQQGDLVWGTYQGGGVRFGTLVAVVQSNGQLDMRYQQIASNGAIKAGRCLSTLHVLPDGRLRIHERWSWTEGGSGSGESWIEEVAP